MTVSIPINVTFACAAWRRTFNRVFVHRQYYSELKLIPKLERPSLSLEKWKEKVEHNFAQLFLFV